jgi:hypothetical protein
MVIKLGWGNTQFNGVFLSMRRILEGCIEEEKVGRVQVRLAHSARLNFDNLWYYTIHDLQIRQAVCRFGFIEGKSDNSLSVVLHARRVGYKIRGGGYRPKFSAEPQAIIAL